MFNELAEIAAFAQRLVHARESSMSNWRQVFALFLALERLHQDAGQVAAMLQPGTDLSPAFPSTRPRYMKVGNEMFEELDRAARAMVESMSALCVYGSSKILMPDQHLEHAFTNHFHPKSHWYIQFLAMYSSGRISADGAMIERMIFRLHPAPAKRLLSYDLEHALCVSEMLDCSTEPARAAIATRCAEPLLALKASSDAFSQLLRERCSIEDLLCATKVTKS